MFTELIEEFLENVLEKSREILFLKTNLTI